MRKILSIMIFRTRKAGSTYLQTYQKFDKRDVKYYEEIGKHIFELASQNKGGTLILFTAKDDIDGVYNDLSKRKFNKTIYVDDGSKSQNEIIESFKN